MRRIVLVRLLVGGKSVHVTHEVVIESSLHVQPMTNHPAQPTGDGGSATNQTTAILEIEQEGEILILKLVVDDLHDLDEWEIDGAVNELLEQMNHSGITDVFLDLYGTDVVHSQALRLAVELWKRVRSHGGSMGIGLI